MSLPTSVDSRHTSASARLVNPLDLQTPQLASPPRPDLAHPPLTAPNYWQQTCCWCNLASLTNGARYHRGAWLAGGLGSDWADAAIWYLAGKGRQPHDAGFFWEETLRRVGMLDEGEVPGSFPPTYRNEHFEFRHWPMGSRNPDDWNQTWQDFKSYVEGALWGQPGQPPRPVVLGWHHTRLITGSDGTNLYLNDPGGAQFAIYPWEQLRRQVIDKIAGSADEDVRKEGYGTLIFLSAPRPEEERRGALWLLEHSEPDVQGGLVFCRGTKIAATWHWGGDAGHLDGYYFRGEGLPSHQRFGVSFPVQQGDCIEYQFYIQNTDFETHRYSAEVELLQGAGADTLTHLLGPNVHAEVELDGRPYGPNASETRTQRGPYRGTFDVGGLLPDVYTVRFTLRQGSVVQDVKHLSFAVTPPKITGTYDLSASYWRVLYGLVDDSPGGLINIETGKVKPIPPEYRDAMKYMLIDEIAKTISDGSALQMRRVALESMISTLQRDLAEIIETAERER